MFSFVTGIGIFGTVYLTPLFLGRVRGFDAWQIGMALLSAGLFQFLAVPIYGTLANRIDLRWLTTFGLACFAMAMWLFTPVTHDWRWYELFAACFGLAVVMVPLMRKVVTAEAPSPEAH